MKKAVLIAIPVLLIVYVLFVCVPYTGQGAATEETKENFHIEEFYNDTESGERAKILFTNEEALKERLSLIANARERIVLSTFDFKADNSGKWMLSALYNAAERGVQVEVLIDGFSFFSLKSGKEYFKALGSLPNAAIKIYNPVNLLKPAKLMARLHDKYLIVDDTAYIVGGRNTYDYFLGDETDYKNYDWDVLVYGEDAFPSLKELQAYAGTMWENADSKVKCEEKNPGSRTLKAAEELKALYEKGLSEHPGWFVKRDYREETEPVNKITILTNPIQAGIKEPVLFYEMTELMAQAGEPVTFHTPYIMCNDYMMERLKEVCDSTETTMMTNSVANNGNPFGAVDYQVHRQALLDTGLAILEYDKGVSYHGKCFRIGDRLTAIGSFNWDMRSTYLDTEMMLVIDSETLNAQMRDYMESYEQDAFIVNADGSVKEQDGVLPQALSGKRKWRVMLIRPFDSLLRFLM